MKKNDVFTFTAPNGAVVLGIVIDLISYETHIFNPNLHIAVYLCYAQNRIFKCYSINHFGEPNEAHYLEFPEEYIVVEYAVLPDYDVLLEEYQRDIDMKNASIQPWEEEFERELQGCNDKFLV